MGKIVWFLLVYCIPILSLAQEEKKIEEIWRDTNYSFDTLFAEPDFNPEFCHQKQRYFTACLQTLNSLLNGLPQNPQKLQLRLSEKTVQMEIVPYQKPKAAPTQEHRVQLLNNFKKDTVTVFQYGKKSNLEELFESVKLAVKKEINLEDQPMFAGLAYKQQLQAAFDAHWSFVPVASFGQKAEKFVGIGARIGKYNQDVAEPSNNFDLKGAVSLVPTKDSPAERAGLKKGDLILAINGVSVLDKSMDVVVNMVRGPKDSEVKLNVLSVCENQIKDVIAVRGPIHYMADWMKDSRFVNLDESVDEQLGNQCEEVPTVADQQRPQALYAKLASFNPPAGKDLCKEFISLQIRDLENPASLGMILDLRGNGGGLVSEVVCMLDSLIPSTEPVLRYLPVLDGEIAPNAVLRVDPENYFSMVGPLYNDEDPLLTRFHYNKPIVVLIDSMSASASEIFAGTIQDMGRGWVIGDRSFGKGSQQVAKSYEGGSGWKDGSELLYKIQTESLYILASGRTPQEYGIIPDFRVNSIGETIVEGEDFVVFESSLDGVISFSHDFKWEQPRPSEFKELETCTQKPGKTGEALKLKIQEDPFFLRPNIADFPLDLAKDVLSCVPAVQPLI